jgi:CheY-like chemotaxis protein
VITNFINCLLLKKIKIAGHVECVINVDKAMKFITQFASENNNHCPELILLDLNMPGADGFDFVKTFKSMPFVNKDKVKLILLTTSTHTKDLDLIQKEFLGYINKPLTEAKLIDALYSVNNIS